MAVALALSVEILRFAEESQRAKAWLHAIAQPTSGVRLVTTKGYRGDAEILALWGPGAPARGAIMAQHVANGGRCVVFDLAYWQRDTKIRVSIDAAHPVAHVLRKDWPASRLNADGVVVRSHWNADGPVIVAGLGRKARVQYGDQVSAWEVSMIAACRERWPSRRVQYRRKQTDAPIPVGVALASDQPIGQVLSGASLVVTWHSNVAVDAIRMGIPVICRDGAAAAVCPSELGADDPQPLDPVVRDRFLTNLAWFQWAPAEAAAFWRWLPEVLA